MLFVTVTIPNNKIGNKALIQKKELIIITCLIWNWGCFEIDSVMKMARKINQKVKIKETIPDIFWSLVSGFDICKLDLESILSLSFGFEFLYFSVSVEKE